MQKHFQCHLRRNLLLTSANQRYLCNMANDICANCSTSRGERQSCCVTATTHSYALKSFCVQSALQMIAYTRIYGTRIYFYVCMCMCVLAFNFCALFAHLAASCYVSLANMLSYFAYVIQRK